MLDVRSGRIAYAVLAEGGFLGMGSNLHAIPWSALTLDTDEKCFVVDIAAQRIKMSRASTRTIGRPWSTRGRVLPSTSITTVPVLVCDTDVPSVFRHRPGPRSYFERLRPVLRIVASYPCFGGAQTPGSAEADTSMSTSSG